MKIERDVQGLHPLPKDVVGRIVEIDAVRRPVDHRTGEAEIVHATLELVRSRSRILHGEVGKARIAARLLRDLPGQQVVRLRRELPRLRRVGLDLHARSRDRQDRPGHPGLVHLRQPLLAEIRQPADHRRQDVRGERGRPRLEVAQKGRRDEVLLQRNLRPRRIGTVPACGWRRLGLPAGHSGDRCGSEKRAACHGHGDLTHSMAVAAL